MSRKNGVANVEYALGELENVQLISFENKSGFFAVPNTICPNTICPKLDALNAESVVLVFSMVRQMFRHIAQFFAKLKICHTQKFTLRNSNFFRVVFDMVRCD